MSRTRFWRRTAVALPCRVRHADRKGKVESAVGHAQATPLKGLRFERLAEAQAYLDRWETRWADTRIHGTTKRQVAAMFAEERPALLPLPVEPFRYYRYGTRTVHLDGCVEIDRAYYPAPPGWIGRAVAVQWDGRQVRLLDPTTGQLLREHRPQRPGGYAPPPADQPTRTPPTTLALLARATRAGTRVGALCEAIHRRDGVPGVRRILGVLALAKQYGPAVVDDACAAALECGATVPLRPPLSRAPPRGAPHAPPGRSLDPRAHPLPRGDRAEDPGGPDMTLVELQRALRQLRCSGLAAGLEGRLLQAQAEHLAPIDFLSTLVQDELLTRQDRLLERRLKQAGFRDAGKTLDTFEFDFNKKMPRALVFELATGRFITQREDGLFLGRPESAT